jgi:superfamily II DNA/RNA helicase
MAKATPTNARAAAGGESGGGRAKAGGGGASRHKQRAQSRRDAELDEIKQLEAALSANAPAPGSNPLAADHAPGTRARKFTQLPLSRLTLNGLKQHKFVSMTAIQRATLPHALCGRDVLGGAKTGSGKTLSYLIPVRHTHPCHIHQCGFGLWTVHTY